MVDFPTSLVERVFKNAHVKEINGLLVGADPRNPGTLTALEHLEGAEFPYRASTMNHHGFVYASEEFTMAEKRGVELPIARRMIDYNKAPAGVSTVTTIFNEEGDAIRHSGLTVNWDPRETSAVEAQNDSINRAYALQAGFIKPSEAINLDAIMPATDHARQFAAATAASRAYINQMNASERNELGDDEIGMG